MVGKKGQHEKKMKELKEPAENPKGPVKAFMERIKSAVGSEVKSFAEDAKELGKEAKKQGSRVKEGVEKASKTVKPRIREIGATLGGKKTVVKVFAEFEGRQLAVEEFTACAKEVYLAENPAVGIESLELYIKPEENTACYVVDGDAFPSYRLVS